MSLNKATLISNVSRDPDVRYFNSGVAVVNLPPATSEHGYTLASGTVIPGRTEWHNIVVCRDLVPFVGKQAHKGSGVYMESKIRTRSYDDQSDVRRHVTKIHADRIEFYGTGPRPVDGGNTTAQGGSMQLGVGQGQSIRPTTVSNVAYQQLTASQPNAFLESSDTDDLLF